MKSKTLCEGCGVDVTAIPEGTHDWARCGLSRKYRTRVGRPASAWWCPTCMESVFLTWIPVGETRSLFAIEQYEARAALKDK